jgi:hypothetical protein
MKAVNVILAISLLTIASQTRADEHRGGDAALGALSGAVVLGPVGAVAGAVVGYTAGPSIAHAWGFRRSGSATRRTRAARQEAPAAEAHSTPTTGAVAVPAPRPKTASTAPPVQTLE